MKILLIDTSADQAIIALKQETWVINKFSTKETAKKLPLAIDAILQGESPKTLSFVAVGVGPGSFTGTRIGVTCATTLAWSLQIPCYSFASPQLFEQKDLFPLALPITSREALLKHSFQEDFQRVSLSKIATISAYVPETFKENSSIQNFKKIYLSNNSLDHIIHSIEPQKSLKINYI